MKRALLVAGAATIMAVGGTTMAQASTTVDTATAVAGVQIGPANSWALAVNDHGDVAGDLSVNNVTEGFYWHGGNSTDLGSLISGGDTEVAAINQHGAVVGEAQAAGGTWHAFLWHGGKMTDLGVAGLNSAASRINDDGQVIGTSSTASGQVDAAVWRDGRMTTLPGLGGYSEVAGENNAGLIVGSSQTASGEWHAVVWSQNGKLTDLGPGTGVAVNNSGQVLVWGFSAEQAEHAFLWHDGRTTDLPSGLWGVTGLNDKGQVVGSIGSETTGIDGFLWSNGTMTDLGAVQPIAINNRGQILIYGGSVMENGTTITLSPTSGSGVTPNAISDNGLVVGLSTDMTTATVWQVPLA
jgi:probable HAF family extracellular repeat protein